ncbi:MAG: hypothetical protein ACREI3_12235 [Nitrospirales bacterium]
MRQPQAKALTHDERKASEAAFQGEPFNPAWSDSARAVYDGVVEAMAKRGARSVGELATELAAPEVQEAVLVSEES